MQKNRIVVDSCCDLTPEMRAEMDAVSVPLTMDIDGQNFRDDEMLDIVDFRNRVSQYNGKVGSAAPPPFLFEQAMTGCESAYGVTLSRKLSSSYSNAVLGGEDAAAANAAQAYVFDSKSAAAGETLIAVKLHELLQAETPRELLIETMHRFIDDMKTYFVLENYDNLQKNGRLSKVKGTLIQMLNIKLIMGADGNGEIALFEKCRGIKSMVQHMLALIERSGKDTRDGNLVISHCNNPGLAEQLRCLALERFHFKKIFIVPMGGLSSMYVDDKGLVMAF